MKYILKFTLLPVIIIMLLLTGCKKDTSSTLSGNIYGYVTLYDQYGGQILTGSNTTALTLNGNTEATNDTTGKYTFTNLNAGEYTLSASNPGFGSINGATFQFTGGGNLDHDVKLSQIPNFSDSALVVTTDTVTYVTVNGVFTTSDLHRRTAALFIGNASSVTAMPSSYLREYTITANTSNYNTFTFKIAISDLNDAGFTTGATVYFAAYGAATEFASSSEWEDVTNTGRLNYTAISNTFATTSIVLP